MFGKKPTIKEQQRENERNLRKAGRGMEREKRKLEEEERKLQQEIRKNAAQGNNEACRLLAKQLVAIRKQKSRTMAANSKITSISYQNKTIGTNVTLTNALKSTSGTMADMNRILKPEAITGNIREFQKANMKMEMTDDLINDTLDELLDDSDDEAQTNAVMNQVLDEIGIEISGRMSNAPTIGAGDDTLNEHANRNDKAILDQLTKLRS